jgi:hypothetical protein
MKFRGQIPVELIFWMSALLLLGSAGLTSDPTASHLTLCPLANLGFDWCPGCGIGRSIAYLLQGELMKSLQNHWFGLPALLIICYRIYTLMKLELSKRFKEKEKSYV